MNENQSSQFNMTNDASNQPGSELVPATPAASNDESNTTSTKGVRSLFNQPAVIVGVVLTTLLIIHWMTTQSQMSSLKEELARRLQHAETNSVQTLEKAKDAQQTVKDMHSKVILLEGKQSEAQNQQIALEQLYQDLSKNRDEWALAEIEQVLATASQQLQLAGNVQGALIALQSADARLAKSDRPQFISVRRAIAKDIEKLKSLPAIDMPGLALRLDTIISQVEEMPLWASEKPVVVATPPKAPLRVLPKTSSKSGKNENGEENAWSVRLQDSWQSFSSEMWGEVKQLVRIRQVEAPDVLMVAPSQAYFLKENLKLRLLNARLALLARNEAIFRGDLITAQNLISKYFDTRARQTQSVQAVLRQMQGSNLSIEMPNLSESLNAIRNFKVKP